MNSTIFGRIGRDAELRQTSTGMQIANFSVVLNVYNKDGNKVTWVNAAVFGKQAESLAPYLTKGTTVALSGDLILQEYESRDGGTKTSLNMQVNSVSLLGGGQREEKPQRPQQNNQRRPAQQEDYDEGDAVGDPGF